MTAFTPAFRARPLCDQALTLFAAMTSQPDLTRKLYYSQFIVSMKGGGVWPLRDGIYMLAAHDGQASLLNLKNPGSQTLVVTSSPTFTVDRGYTGDGVDDKLQVNVSGGGYGINNANRSAWCFAAGTDNSNISGDSGNRNRLNPKDGSGNASASINSSAGVGLATGLPRTGYVAADISVSGTQSLSRDGGSRTTAATSLESSSTTLKILGGNNTNFTDAGVAFAAIGQSLTLGQEQAEFAAVRTYLQNVGAA